MEFVEGVSLREKLRRSGITLAQALEYGAQVLGALAYAHGHGVVHRDVKPSNVMIGPHGMVKLLDFGLAASSVPGGQDLELTRPGTMLGSPHYLSPEQARGERADARSDIYSTGAMLYEMVAGKPPFDSGGSGGAYAIIAAHLSQIPRSPSDVNPQVPAALARVILKALAKRPAERFSSAEEFLGALDTIRLNDTATVVAQNPIPDDESTVMASSSRPTPAEAPAIVAGVSRAAVYSDAELERVSKDLATYIGPIAHILVRRAAPGSPTLIDLYQTLANEISSAGKREEFLGRMPRALSRSTSVSPSGAEGPSGD
jgi:eukaryotic-like serine/threonine-protein kinase